MTIFVPLVFWGGFIIGGVAFILLLARTRKQFNMLVRRNQTAEKRRPLVLGKHKHDLTKVIKQHVQQNRSISPKQLKTFVVPYYDYDLLISIRVAMARGSNFVVVNPDDLADSIVPLDEDESKVEQMANQLHCMNAEVLHKYYGMSAEQVFMLTGHIIGTAGIKDF